MITSAMRVPIRCPDCTTDACTSCGASRVVEELYSAWLAVPPEVAEGTILRPLVKLEGMVRPVGFRVRSLPRERY